MPYYNKDIKIFSGNSNPTFAKDIAKIFLKNPGDINVTSFSDGEISVSIEETTRGFDIFIIQSTCLPVNDNLMELLIMIDAFRRASAGRINAVIPYYGYARQDRKVKARDPISAKLVADLIERAGADRVLTMDLHAPQIQGFFDIPVDHLLGSPIFAPYYQRKMEIEGNHDDYVVLAPDLGSVSRSRKFAETLDIPLAIIDKRRPKANVSEVMNIIGNVKDKKVIMIDDMVDTAGTLTQAANAVIEKGGAKEVVAGATHAILSEPAIERIEKSALKELVFLDTIAIPPSKMCSKIKVLSAAPVFAEAIRRIHEEESVSVLFD